MFEELTSVERRRILLASRIRLTPEVRVPRQRAVEKMIENALYSAPPDEWHSAYDIIAAFKLISGLRTLRLPEVERSLGILVKEGRVDRQAWRYRLSQVAADELNLQFGEASGRLDRVLNSLYGDVVGKEATKLAPFFLEFACDVFSHLGIRWAGYLSGEEDSAVLDLTTLERLADREMKKHDVQPALQADIRRRSIKFFQETDPDYDYLKFSLGQSFYVARLLGIEGRDYLSEEIFRGGHLYLDSSVIIAAMLSASRHHRVFQELLRICGRLGIRLYVTRPTIDEVRRVAADQEKIAPLLYDQIPEKLSPQVRGTFYHTYVGMKKLDPNVRVEDLFEPFHRLAETLTQSLGVEVIDSTAFEELLHSSNFETMKQVFQESSVLVRKKEKFSNALEHDVQIFLYLQLQCRDATDKVWLVTRDTSLPPAWSKLGPLHMRAFLLDGLLQSISPFAAAEEEIQEFSEIFSQIVASQLVPQSRLFDVEDFLVFQEIEMDCNELTEDEIQEGLLRVKQNVLRGASYRHEDLEPAAYELRRFFTTRKDRVDALTSERDRLEATISGMEEAIEKQRKDHSAHIANLKEQHDSEVQTLGTRIDGLEKKEEGRLSRQKRLLKLIKKCACWLVLAVLLVAVGWAAVKFGEGPTKALRFRSFTLYFGLAVVLWLVLVRTIIFRRESLKEVFPSWAEVKDILPF